MSAMRRFLGCKKGNFAAAFALSMVPVMGAAGVATDYSRAINVRSYLQSQTDMAVLAGAQLGPDGDATAVIAYVRASTRQRYGKDWIKGLTVEGEWVSQVDYRVTAQGKVPTTILNAVPGFPDGVIIGVSATARVAEPRFVYEPPKVSELDNEAGDYNRVYVYCFDSTKVSSGGTGGTGGYDDVEDDDREEGRGRGRGHGDGRDHDGNDDDHDWDDDDDHAEEDGDPVPGGSEDGARTQMTAIADNAGTRYDFEMPKCDAGQTLSFRLMNVRLVRDQPSKWEDPNSLRFDYYTDTQVKNGADKHDLGGWSVLETVLCDNLEECDKQSKGGIVPEGKNRDPIQADRSCSPGQFMYYGWEDRPPGMPGSARDWTDVAWTDRDYDDIRIVIECPVIETVEDRQVRLID